MRPLLVLLLLIRSPLARLLLLEAVLVAGLGLAAFHAWQSHASPPRPAPPALAPAPSARPRQQPLPAPTPGLRTPIPRAAPSPSVHTDPGFLLQQLQDLNTTNAAFEKLQWRATSALTQAIRDYLDRVVLPSIDRSEGRAR